MCDIIEPSTMPHEDEGSDNLLDEDLYNASNCHEYDGGDYSDDGDDSDDEDLTPSQTMLVETFSNVFFSDESISLKPTFFFL